MALAFPLHQIFTLKFQNGEFRIAYRPNFSKFFESLLSAPQETMNREKKWDERGKSDHQDAAARGTKLNVRWGSGQLWALGFSVVFYIKY